MVMKTKTGTVHVFRVKPDKDLVEAIIYYCKSNNISSAAVTGIIGSLNSVKLGFLKELPGKYDTKDFNGPLEIVCAQGTVALCENELVLHIHIMVSDENHSIGGHLTCAEVFSTAEVTLTVLDNQIERIVDTYTGLKELYQKN